MTNGRATPDEIWADDLFDRQKEAGLLIGYLESVAQRPGLREDVHGYTIAVDARYGEGKTFFLKRLAEQLKLDHPVAFVDAWTDDLADEPLTALTATLKKALDPLIKQSTDVGSKFQDFIEKTGKVAKIVGKGLAKRGLALAITSAAAEALETMVSGIDEPIAEAIKEKAKSAGDDLVEDGAAALQSVAPGKLMEERIETFEAGQKAIEDIRRSLEALVASLDGQDRKAPIFIIIDELDRCRPTYAVKLLEEIKHLFDVPGLIFILGLHGEQLAHSVSAAYGTEFDGKAYLRRFFQRQYRLAEPDLAPLIDHLCEEAGIRSSPVNMLPFSSEYGRNMPQLSEAVAAYMAAYGVSARSAFEIVDILQTCFALVQRRPLYLNYLLPLVIGHVQGLPPGTLPTLPRAVGWRLFQPSDHFSREGEELAPDSLAEEFSAVCGWSRGEIVEGMNSNWPRYAVRAGYENDPSSGGQKNLASVHNYPALLTTVARFQNPNLAVG